MAKAQRWYRYTDIGRVGGEEPTLERQLEERQRLIDQLEQVLSRQFSYWGDLAHATECLKSLKEFDMRTNWAYEYDAWEELLEVRKRECSCLAIHLRGKKK